MHASEMPTIKGGNLYLAEVLGHTFVAGHLLGRSMMGTSMFPSTSSRQSQSRSGFSQRPFR